MNVKSQAMFLVPDKRHLIKKKKKIGEIMYNY